MAALDTTTLPFLVVPALAAALFARLTSFWIACICGLGIGMLESLIEYSSTKSWFPTTDGLAIPGVKELLVFVLIVAAMFLRGASLPTRGELIEKRLPDVPRPKNAVKIAIPVSVLCAIALVVLPFDFRQALVQLDARRAMISPVAHRRCRLRRADLGRAGAAGRRRGLHHVAHSW